MLGNLRTSTLRQQDKIEQGALSKYLNKFIEINMGKEDTTYNMVIELFKWINSNTNIDSIGFEEILKGAYVLINGDNGDLYEIMKGQLDRVKDGNSSLNRGRVTGISSLSSHNSLKEQMRLGHGDIYNVTKDGKLNEDQTPNKFFDLLFGVNASGNTWFQLEYSKIGGKGKIETIKNLCYHSGSFIKYLLTGYNQGPFGSSFYTEKGLNYILNKTEYPSQDSSIENENRKQQKIQEERDKHCEGAYSFLGRYGGKKKTRKRTKRRRKKSRKKRTKRRRKKSRKKRTKRNVYF